MQNKLLKIFLGFVFLSAGIFRIFNWPTAILEFKGISVNFAYPLLVLTIIIEIAGGLFLILDKKIKLVSTVFIILILSGIIINLFKYGSTIFQRLNELFFLNPNPTDLFLHATYLVILLSFILSAKSIK